MNEIQGFQRSFFKSSKNNWLFFECPMSIKIELKLHAITLKLINLKLGGSFAVFLGLISFNLE